MSTYTKRKHALKEAKRQCYPHETDLIQVYADLLKAVTALQRIYIAQARRK